MKMMSVHISYTPTGVSENHRDISRAIEGRGTSPSVNPRHCAVLRLWKLCSNSLVMGLGVGDKRPGPAPGGCYQGNPWPWWEVEESGRLIPCLKFPIPVCEKVGLTRRPIPSISWVSWCHRLVLAA